MSRWLFLLFLLPNCTGCLAYAYPTLAYTPEVVVPNHDGSVHAFRVDIDKTERRQGVTASAYTLTPIPIERGGVVPSQLEIAPASGVYDPFGLYFGGQQHTDYTLAVRLYRPGYQMMEVKAWDKSRPLQWTEARDLVAQEKAIDDLLADPAAPTRMPQAGVSATLSSEELARSMRPSWWEQKDERVPTHLALQPGSVSPTQKHALLFAANEYQRLAETPTAKSLNMRDLRERLQQKAIWLRRYAEQTP